MTEITIQVDDVQEFIIQKISEDDADTQQLVQEVFDSGLWQLYQQWKAVEDGETPDIEPDV